METSQDNYEELLQDENFEEILNTEDLDDEALWNERRKNARHIPLDGCTPIEQVALTKCVAEQTLTPEEEETLLSVLERYDEAIQKQKPQEILDNYEKNQEYVQAEKTFLQILQEQEQEDKTITMNYPLNNGQIHKIQIKVKKVDSEAVADIQKNLGMFDDFTQEENRVRIKAQQGTKLSREEQLILNNLQRRLNEKVFENQEELMIRFLTKTTTIIDEPETTEYLRQVYSSMDYYYLEKLFEKVSVVSGFHRPGENELFQ